MTDLTAPEKTEPKKFHLKCKAVLLTYHIDIDFEEIKGLPVWRKHVRRFSLCTEKEGDHTGSHAFLEFWNQVDHDLDCWYLGDGSNKCDAQPNSAKGSGYRPSADRAHFYVVCKDKKGKGKVETNWYPNKDYVVSTRWVLTLWQKGKLEEGSAIDCAAYYLCLTHNFKQQVNVNRGFRIAKIRQEHFDKRRKLLAKTKFAYTKVPKEFYTWKKTYEKTRHRYKFLWMWSPENIQWVGKSEFIRQEFKGGFIHDGAISWSGYDPSTATAVVFDDCAGICDYIKNNKPLFQANREKYIVNSSATNMYAEEIDTCDKKIIVLANFAPKAEWTKVNAFIIELKEKLY